MDGKYISLWVKNLPLNLSLASILGYDNLEVSHSVIYNKEDNLFFFGALLRRKNEN